MYQSKSFRFLGGFVFLFSCALSPEFVGEDQAIVGGEFESAFPEIGLIDGGGFICTGTLIRADVVLTAGHCISSPNVTRFLISAGEGPEQEFIAGFDAKQTIAHPDFDINNLGAGNDIGIILLEDNVPSEIATPMEFLQETLDPSFLDKDFLAVGYGVTDFEGGGSGVKRSVTLSLTSILQGLYEYGNAQRNVCSGDSGGPDIMNIEGVDTILGVHSFVSGSQGGPGLCRENSFSTRVDVHLDDFILPILNGEAPPDNSATCSADGECIAACGNTDPDCECRQDGFCDEVCENGIAVDPDCCGADAACNEACSANGLVDNDCFGGACTISPELSAQNPNSPYGILFSLFGIIVFGFFTLRRRS